MDWKTRVRSLLCVPLLPFKINFVNLNRLCFWTTPFLKYQIDFNEEFNYGRFFACWWDHQWSTSGEVEKGLQKQNTNCLLRSVWRQVSCLIKFRSIQWWLHSRRAHEKLWIWITHFAKLCFRSIQLMCL